MLLSAAAGTDVSSSVSPSSGGPGLEVSFDGLAGGGVPVVFFDVLVFPDGSFRPVDKKHYFNTRDHTFFLKRKPDILLIGSGYEGRGGKGFFDTTPNQFIYNPYIRQGTQLIILPTPDACELFNRMKRAQKNVLFVIHSTC